MSHTSIIDAKTRQHLEDEAGEGAQSTKSQKTQSSNLLQQGDLRWTRGLDKQYWSFIFFDIEIPDAHKPKHPFYSLQITETKNNTFDVYLVV